MAPQSRGAFIVIEGLDRSGKSTQHGRACDHLEAQARAVKRMRFPDRSTTIGSAISNYLQGLSNVEDHAIHLLFSANRWEAEPSIVEAINAGTTVVTDRYYYSGIVYSAAKERQDLSLQWARAPDVGLPKPDLVIFLDIDTATARARGGYGEERYEREAMQNRVKQLFYEIIRQEGKGQDITRIVDASQSMDQVADVVGRVIDDLFEGEALDQPLQRIGL